MRPPRFVPCSLWKTLSLLAFAMASALPMPAWSGEVDRAAAGTVATWPGGVFRWRYNPDPHPAWLSADQAAAMVRDAAKKWEACGVRMEYQGETTLRPGIMDGENVVGWAADLPGGVRGLTQGRARGRRLVERDIGFAPDRLEFKRFPRLLEKVLAHEFGHAIGMTHSPACNDVMTLAADCPRAPAASLPVVPTENDLARCRAGYANELR
jgi:hypothetical protein